MSSNTVVINADDRRLLEAEDLISFLLRGGVLLSAGLICFGLFLSWIMAHPRGFSSEDLTALLSGKTLEGMNPPIELGRIVDGLGIFDPSTIISTGLIVLIALPILRVGLTVVLFMLERDYLYLFITCIVLCVLISGIMMGQIL